MGAYFFSSFPFYLVLSILMFQKCLFLTFLKRLALAMTMLRKCSITWRSLSINHWLRSSYLFYYNKTDIFILQRDKSRTSDDIQDTWTKPQPRTRKLSRLQHPFSHSHEVTYSIIINCLLLWITIFFYQSFSNVIWAWFIKLDSVGTILMWIGFWIVMTLLFFVHLYILVSIHKQCYLSLVCQSRFYETILTDLRIVMTKTKHQGCIVLPSSVPVHVLSA